MVFDIETLTHNEDDGEITGAYTPKNGRIYTLSFSLIWLRRNFNLFSKNKRKVSEETNLGYVNCLLNRHVIVVTLVMKCCARLKYT